MDWIKHEKADQLPVYTYQQYLKEKSVRRKDSFAYVYWEATEKYFDEEHLLSVYSDSRHYVDPGMFCAEMGKVFSRARAEQEAAVQTFLLDHNGEIDQWPDPCFPRCWVVEPLNGYGYLFDNHEEGFVFNYFGGDYQIQENGHAGQENRLRLSYGKILPEYRHSTAEREKRWKEWLARPKGTTELEDAQKKVKKEKDKLDQINRGKGAFAGELLYTLLEVIAAAVCIAWLIYWTGWHMSGKDLVTLDNDLKEIAGNGSQPAVIMLVRVFALQIYLFLYGATFFLGPVPFWIAEGIVALITFRLLKDAMTVFTFGRRQKLVKEKIREQNTVLNAAEREEREAQEKIEQRRAEIKKSEEYKLFEWWRDHEEEIGEEWHRSWYNWYVDRYSVHRISTAEEQKKFEKYHLVLREEPGYHTVRVYQEKWD